MGYIPNTPRDKIEMLEALGLESFEELLKNAVPKNLLRKEPIGLDEGLSEYEAFSEAAALAGSCAESMSFANFMGAGAYDHFIPAAVHHISGRPEFETAYTPYQAEVSQGTLQAIFEYQSLICRLTGMEVANASMYDGPSALAESLLLAVSQTDLNRIIIAPGLNPFYLEVLRTYTKPTGIELVICDSKDGQIDCDSLAGLIDNETAAVVVQNPNFFGCIEDGFAIQKTIAKTRAILIVVSDPISLGMLTPPGEYGADIVVAEGQALGNPLGYGGPYLGVFAAKEKFLRMMPGRIIGASTDDEGTRGFVMTMQTREQHIRREKATSNICTNQALCALNATVYLSLIGEDGLKEIAGQCYDKSHYMANKLLELPGVSPVYNSPFFKEFIVRLPVEAKEISKRMALEGFLAGVPLSIFDTERPFEMLVAVTEKRSKREIDQYIDVLRELLAD